MAPGAKHPPANAGHARDKGSVPVSGRPPEGGNGNPASILAWTIPWTEEPGELSPKSWIQLSDLARVHTSVG